MWRKVEGIWRDGDGSCLGIRHERGVEVVEERHQQLRVRLASCLGAHLMACKNGVASSHRVWRADDREELMRLFAFQVGALPLF
jgi:hypothetical protein